MQRNGFGVLHYYAKVNQKWIKDLKPLKYRGESFMTLFGNGFLDMAQKAQATKEKIEIWVPSNIELLFTKRHCQQRKEQKY